MIKGSLIVREFSPVCSFTEILLYSFVLLSLSLAFFHQQQMAGFSENLINVVDLQTDWSTDRHLHPYATSILKVVSIAWTFDSYDVKKKVLNEIKCTVERIQQLIDLLIAVWPLLLPCMHLPLPVTDADVSLVWWLKAYTSLWLVT